MPLRATRYQAAVVRDGRLLLVRIALTDGRAFWLLPGGGREAGDDTAEDVVEREVLEETGLAVKVGRLLSDVAAHPDDSRYARWRTHLCRVVGGEAAPGAGDGSATVSDLMWLILNDVGSWPAGLRDDRFLYPQLIRIAAAIDFVERQPPSSRGREP